MWLSKEVLHERIHAWSLYNLPQLIFLTIHSKRWSKKGLPLTCHFTGPCTGLFYFSLYKYECSQEQEQVDVGTRKKKNKTRQTIDSTLQLLSANAQPLRKGKDFQYHLVRCAEKGPESEIGRTGFQHDISICQASRFVSVSSDFWAVRIKWKYFGNQNVTDK